MKFIRLFWLPAVLLLLAFKALHPWTGSQLMSTAELNKLLQDKNKSPLLINVGSMEQIKSAVKTGPASSKEGLQQLNTRLASIQDKSKTVVIYCGCCTLDNCPNLKPAYDVLTKAGFKDVKILDLPVGLVPDWKAKGYPME